MRISMYPQLFCDILVNQRGMHMIMDAVMNNKSYFFIFDNTRLLVLNMDGELRIPRVDDLVNTNSCFAHGRFFGSYNGIGCFCYKNPNDFKPEANMSFIELRELGSMLDREMFLISCRGLHFLRWFEDNLYCSRCGSLAEDKKDEIARICPKCGLINYPRISPAIIVAIVNKDRLLLANNSRFKNGMYSVIAGFVEPGETFEDCVIREVMEEVGIEVKNIRYFGSQPWPFPDSLMIGFTAEYAGGEIREDGVEILHAGWYGAKELPKTPTGASIAGRLIKWFVENHS